MARYNQARAAVHSRLTVRSETPKALAVSADNKWVASGGCDLTIRLWPMPDLTKPPFQTLPYEELLAKLESLTNRRIVRDEASETGWNIIHEPFPGWENPPTW